MESDTSGQVEFGILGPLSIKQSEVAINIRAPKARIIVASLLLRPGRFVSIDEITDRLWDGPAPNGARHAIHSYVNRLRLALGPAGRCIRTDGAGYQIAVPPEAIDLWRSRAYTEQARSARTRADLNAEAAALRNGLALWRGSPLADVQSPFLQTHEVPPLAEERLQLVERLMDVDLQLGKDAELVGSLRSLTSDHPLRERFWFQLMLAQYRSDRQADALNTYRTVSTLLREELGVDPNEQIQELHRRILRADPTLTLTPARTQATVRRETPYQVPPDVADFVGRRELSGEIRSLLDPASRRARIITLTGPPGVGKTALAIHTAHHLRALAPDGQLYINLRGYSPSPYMAPGEALDRFLRSLGLPAEAIPFDLDEKSALFRSLVINRQMLIVLDNAASAEQVRPLLPGGPDCLVIVTSRDNLQGLVALDAARRVAVGAVSADEGLALLSRILGEDRVSAESAAAHELAAACGQLPLALRIVAAKLAADPASSIASFLRQVRSDRLALMAIDGDDSAAVHRAFELSYSKLTSELARMFRLLSVIPGPSFDKHAAASLAAVDPATAKGMLDRLATANLIQASAGGRFQFHDLLREYALGRARNESEVRGGDASRRLFSFYLGSTEAACALLYPDIYRIPTGLPQEKLEPPEWSGPAEALEWLDVELENLVAVVRTPEVHTDQTPPWRLAAALLGYFHEKRRDSQWYETFTTALAAAECTHEHAAVAAMRFGLGRLHLLHMEYEFSRQQLAGALQAYRQSADTVGQLRVLNNLGAVAVMQGAFEEATVFQEQALALRTTPDDPAGRVVAMMNSAIVLHALGHTDYGTRRAVEAQRTADDTSLVNLSARVRGVIALNDMWKGNLAQAAANFDEVLALWTELGYRQSLAETLRNLAETHFEADRFDESRMLARQAAVVAEELNYAWVTVGSAVTVGLCCLHLGDYAQAAAHQRAAQEHARSGLRYWYPVATLGLAACHRAMGELDLAAKLAEECLSDARPRQRGRAHLDAARTALAAGSLDKGFRHGEEARRIGENWGYQLDEARALEVMATVRRYQGDDGTARTLLRRARDRFDPENQVAARRVQNSINTW